MITLVTSLLLAFMYRLRGGGYVTLGKDVYTRLIWSGAMVLSFALQDGVHLWVLLALFMSSYLSMLVPHAYCQNMGQWPTPQKQWPSFFFPSWTAAGWTAAPKWQRALYDAGQMACVALVRGAIVFGSVMLISTVDVGVVKSFAQAFAGVSAIMFLQPVGYLFGTYVMFFSVPGCVKFSSNWGEWFNGLGWGLAVALSLAA